jgi:hypothetical protein
LGEGEHHVDNNEVQLNEKVTCRRVLKTPFQNKEYNNYFAKMTSENTLEFRSVSVGITNKCIYRTLDVEDHSKL